MKIELCKAKDMSGISEKIPILSKNQEALDESPMILYRCSETGKIAKRLHYNLLTDCQKIKNINFSHYRKQDSRNKHTKTRISI